ncbi:hypothetical protein MMC20_007127 [Loxospora ochrophaea]|nr:hypothetical protein [Loxospora ochrophaea]
MRGRIERETSSPTEHAQDNIVANQALATVPTSVRFDKTAELEQANVLYSLLENKFSKRYPVSERLMKPLSNPTYYIDLIRELEDVPRRSRFRSMLNQWKGWLRFS